MVVVAAGEAVAAAAELAILPGAAAGAAADVELLDAGTGMAHVVIGATGATAGADAGAGLDLDGLAVADKTNDGSEGDDHRAARAGRGEQALIE